MGKKTNMFYGNKNSGNAYFCLVQFDPVATGERITSLRRSRHYSRERLVSELYETDLLHVSITTMGRWERGEVKKMDCEVLEALRLFFQCSHDELVVYRCREIGDERDQLVPFSVSIWHTADAPLFCQSINNLHPPLALQTDSFSPPIVAKSPRPSAKAIWNLQISTPSLSQLSIHSAILHS